MTSIVNGTFIRASHNTMNELLDLIFYTYTIDLYDEQLTHLI